MVGLAHLGRGSVSSQSGRPRASGLSSLLPGGALGESADEVTHGSVSGTGSWAVTRQVLRQASLGGGKGGVAS